MKKIFITFTGVSLILLSCDTRTYDDISPAVSIGSVTYTKDVKPIMSDNCTSCHSSAGGQMPYLENYTDVKNNVQSVLSEMQNGSMPPSGALPASTIQVIQSWKNSGMTQ